MTNRRLRSCATVLAAFFVLSLTACSGSGELAEKSYNPTANRTVYEAKPISFTSTRMQSGLGKNRSLAMKAVATCQGRDCIPNQVELVFSTSSNSSIFLTNRSVSLSTGDETYEWEERRDTDSFEGETVIGRITSITLTTEQLKNIAIARTLDCSIGGAPFQLSFKDRRPLRQLTEKFGPSKPTDQPT